MLSEVRSLAKKWGATFHAVASISSRKLALDRNNILDQSISSRMDQKNSKNYLKQGAGKDFRKCRKFLVFQLPGALARSNILE